MALGAKSSIMPNELSGLFPGVLPLGGLTIEMCSAAADRLVTIVFKRSAGCGAAYQTETILAEQKVLLFGEALVVPQQRPVVAPHWENKEEERRSCPIIASFSPPSSFLNLRVSD